MKTFGSVSYMYHFSYIEDKEVNKLAWKPHKSQKKHTLEAKLGLFFFFFLRRTF